MLLKKTPLAGRLTRRLSIKIGRDSSSDISSNIRLSTPGNRRRIHEGRDTRVEPRMKISRFRRALNSSIIRMDLLDDVFGNNGTCVEHQTPALAKGAVEKLTIHSRAAGHGRDWRYRRELDPQSRWIPTLDVESLPFALRSRAKSIYRKL